MHSSQVEGRFCAEIQFLLSTMQGLLLKENHPLVADITMAVSLGTLPMVLEVNATSCGSTDSVLAKQKPTGAELDREFSVIRLFRSTGIEKKGYSEFGYVLRTKACTLSERY